MVLSKIPSLLTVAMLLSTTGCVTKTASDIKPTTLSNSNKLQLETSTQTVNDLYKMAETIVADNSAPKKQGGMAATANILNAGGEYSRPWTRDASYNTIFSVALTNPKLARNTLESVLEKHADYGWIIGGQYWDAIVWTSAAWDYYLSTGDKDFLQKSYDVSANSLRYFETTQFDEALGLFNGPPTFQDGVAGYPQIYADAGGSSFILDTRAKVKGKVIIKALSTNCLYYNSYRLMDKMEEELKLATMNYRQKAKDLKLAINNHFWLEDKQHYCYLIDAHGKKHDYLEATGNSFLILFDIAPPERVSAILEKQHVTKYGIPCVWPVFPRFGENYGRHNGTVWPFCQGLWAKACADAGDLKRFNKEFQTLTSMAEASNDFREIYHPVTGKPFGGVQTGTVWHSTVKQTWSATAYQSMIFHGLAGMNLSAKGVE